MRDERDYVGENIDIIDELEDSVVPELRRQWQEWNVVRRHLGAEAMARYGVDLETLEAKEAARLEAEAEAARYESDRAPVGNRLSLHVKLCESE